MHGSWRSMFRILMIRGAVLIEKERRREMLWGYLFAIGATAIWSGNFIIARGLSETLSPISLAYYRWAVALLVLLPIGIRPLLREWQELKLHLPYLCLTSLVGVTIFNTMIYVAGHTTTAINLSLISITAPIFIVIFSRLLFAEKITLHKSLGILLVAVGVVLLITGGELARLLRISFAIGDLWMLAAAMFFGLYSILLKYKPRKLSIWAFQLSTFALGLFFLTPFFIWDYCTSPPVSFSASTLGAILYLGVFASLTAFALWNKAILVIGPVRAGMIYYSLPIFSGTAAYLILGEAITSVHLCSVLLIVSGIFTANHDPRKI
ncbi:hypothetical membrane protein [Desulfotalea psychrophila LSv54]|uniref:Hypothetical membrane protein n=1 Tax=Desulfotalea psychrophila (strain LSv54 / DSM 12343) TaxID=177439 RepID=Q6ARU8_DESPS|nr:hypothetical membrane protein [Desulfotalea psychrophila LSv54]